MAKVIQIQLGEYRPIVSFDVADELLCNRDDVVILEVERGVEFGRVVSNAKVPCKAKGEPSQGKVLRLLTDDDKKKIEANHAKAKEALSTCNKKVNERKLDMQIAQCEYAFDESKVIFFFTSEGRVDFRELVKDLARIFRVRIELKQIGVRDKAKIVGGFGVCGRELCCTSYLNGFPPLGIKMAKEQALPLNPSRIAGVCGRELCCTSYLNGFPPLGIKMAKEQALPLNPSRIAGVCGRIKCCMAYEFSVYKEYAKALPKMGEKITTPQGKGKVVDINILKRYVKVDLGEGQMTKVVFTKEESQVANVK